MVSLDFFVPKTRTREKQQHNGSISIMPVPQFFQTGDRQNYNSMTVIDTLYIMCVAIQPICC